MSWPRPSDFDNNGQPTQSSQPNKSNKAKNNEKAEMQKHVDGKENQDVNPQDHEKKHTGEETKAGSRKKKVQRQKWVPLPLHEARQELEKHCGAKTSLPFQTQADLLAQPNEHSDNHRNDQPADYDVGHDSLEDNADEAFAEIGYQSVFPYYVEEAVDDNELLMSYMNECPPYPEESEGPCTTMASGMGLPPFTEPYIMEVQDEHGNVIASTSVGSVTPQIPNDILAPGPQQSQTPGSASAVQTPVSVVVLRMPQPASRMPAPEMESAPDTGLFLLSTSVDTPVPLADYPHVHTSHDTVPESQPFIADDYMPQRQHRNIELDFNLLATSTEASVQAQTKLLECSVQQNMILQGFLEAFQDSVAHQKEAVEQHNRHMSNITKELQAISHKVSHIGVKLSAVQGIKALAESALAALTVANIVSHTAQAFTTVEAQAASESHMTSNLPSHRGATTTTWSTPEDTSSSETLLQQRMKQIHRRPVNSATLRR